jgi:hypothetical protein
MSRASMPFQKERQLDKNAKSPSARADLPPVSTERQSFVIPDNGRLAAISAATVPDRRSYVERIS